MGTKKATDILMEEHREIERMLDVVDRAARRVERGEPVPPRLFVDAAIFFRNFADRCHHGKEEKHLFRRMEERGIAVEGGPLGVMYADHEQGRTYVCLIQAEGQKYAEGGLQSPDLLVGAVRSYVNLLRQHILKEDRILYPMGNQVLTSEDQSALIEDCERVEREEMGEGEHERFHAMIGELERQMAPQQ